jgi:hypothetical protein
VNHIPIPWDEPLWNDNPIQFARLLCEIVATQDNLNFEVLSESMDLEVDDINELLERANEVWELAKANVTQP